MQSTAGEPWTSDLPWQADNEAAPADWARGLAESVHDGRWRPAMGSSDIHLAGQFGTQTVILADDLSTQAILTGIRTGHLDGRLAALTNPLILA